MKIYPGINLGNFNLLSSWEEADALKVDDFGELLEEIPELGLRFGKSKLMSEERISKELAVFVMRIRSDGHFVTIEKLEEITDHVVQIEGSKNSQKISSPELE